MFATKSLQVREEEVVTAQFNNVLDEAELRNQDDRYRRPF